MAKINEKRCNGTFGEPRKVSPLAVENTQEFRDVINMEMFKLQMSVKYLEPGFNNLINSIKGLWLDEGEMPPKFISNFADYWSVNDYAAFCSQVKQWALDHNEDPFKELRRRVREVILCDKKSLQLDTVNRISKKGRKELFNWQANVQQLCNEIGEKDDQIFVDSDAFEHTGSQLGRLKSLTQAMRAHRDYLVNQRLTRRRMVSVNAEKQAELITKPVTKKSITKFPAMKNKPKDNEDGLEM